VLQTVEDSGGGGECAVDAETFLTSGKTSELEPINLNRTMRVIASSLKVTVLVDQLVCRNIVINIGPSSASSCPLSHRLRLVTLLPIFIN
jgi:hypothetical protein